MTSIITRLILDACWAISNIEWDKNVIESGRTPSWPIYNYYTRIMGQNNSSRIVTRLRAGRPRNGNSTPGRGKNVSLQRLDELWGPSSLQFSGYSVLYRRRSSGRFMKLRTHLIYCQLKNKWNYITTPPYIRALCMIINSGGETCGRTDRPPRNEFTLILFISKPSDAKGDAGTRSHNSYLNLTPLH
jgi:hypothetical protein